MAVYKYAYSCYEGALTPGWRRVLVLPRYAYRGVFQSRFFLTFFVVSFVPPVASALIIYLNYNLSALEQLGIPAEGLIAIDNLFFLRLLNIQGALAFLLTAYIGPGLIAPDLANNGLPLYLSRPFSKVQYVAGKMGVLLILLSLMTWVPLVLLFLLQFSLAGWNWAADHFRILPASVMGSAVWIVLLSVLALAISAWVRWRTLAAAVLLGIYFVSAGFAQAIMVTFQTRWAELISLYRLTETVWRWLFLADETRTVTFRVRGAWVSVESMPAWSACLALAVLFGFCLLLLSRRIRAYEVIR